jgi:hypothetical protein
MQSNLSIGPGALDGSGVFADRDFEPGDVVLSYRLRELTLEEFRALPEKEQLLFVHSYGGRRFLYPSPVRYTNHSERPTVHDDFEHGRLVALRHISRGEPITIDAMRQTDRELTTFMEALATACSNGDRDALLELIADTAFARLPDGMHRGAADVAEELLRFHTGNRAIPASAREWIVGRHRWEAVCSAGFADGGARRWHVTAMLEVIEGNWQLVYEHVGRVG